MNDAGKRPDAFQPLAFLREAQTAAEDTGTPWGSEFMAWIRLHPTPPNREAAVAQFLGEKINDIRATHESRVDHLVEQGIKTELALAAMVDKQKPPPVPHSANHMTDAELAESLLDAMTPVRGETRVVAKCNECGRLFGRRYIPFSLGQGISINLCHCQLVSRNTRSTEIERRTP